MANTKISGLASGAPAQNGDLFVIARAGSNFSLTGANLVTLVSGTLAPIASPVFTGIVTLPTGDATHEPLLFSAGANLTTAAAGACEFDGKVFYQTCAANSRQVAVTEQFVALTSTYTLTSQTGAQKLFNQPANGALTLQGSTSYFFECSFSLSGMSSTTGNMGFDVKGAGTATLTSAAWFAHGMDATTQTTPGTTSGVFLASSGQAGNILTASTGTACHVFIKGIIRVNAGGTIIPSVSLTTAAAAIVGVNSYFRCWPIGSNTVVIVGNWS